MHQYRANRYVLRKTSERVCTDGRVWDEIWERVSDFGAGNWKGPTAVSVEPVARYCKQLTFGSVTCHPTEVRILPLPPAEAGTRFSDPGGMQDWVDPCYVQRTGRELNRDLSVASPTPYRWATTHLLGSLLRNRARRWVTSQMRAGQTAIRFVSEKMLDDSA